ncbi:MAG: DUF192 domain-containing protein [Pseudomonadota bacterium]
MIKYLALFTLLLFPLAACDGEKQQLVEAGEGANALQVVTQSGKTYDFNVALALTREEQAQGLMFVEEMADNQGMLFFFGAEAPRSFWMKNTLIPLDILFVKLDGSIMHIHENAIPKDETSIPSNGNAGAVLEINGGLAKKLGIQVGDTINHQFFAL